MIRDDGQDGHRDGEPTPSGDVFFNYPPVTETVEATLREVLRCTRDGIRINTFMLGSSHSLKSFVEDVKARLAEVPSVDFDAVKSFIDEAKAVGHARVASFELQAAVAANTVSKRVADLRKLYAA